MSIHRITTRQKIAKQSLENKFSTAANSDSSINRRNTYVFISLKRGSGLWEYWSQGGKFWHGKKFTAKRERAVKKKLVTVANAD